MTAFKALAAALFLSATLTVPLRAAELPISKRPIGRTAVPAHFAAAGHEPAIDGTTLRGRAAASINGTTIQTRRAAPTVNGTTLPRSRS